MTGDLFSGKSSGRNSPECKLLKKFVYYILCANENVESQSNAYYYFSRLLELQPGNKEAIKGILEIADRYSFLAEQAMLNNDYKKSSAYIDIGLRINPKNEALLSLQNLVKSQNTSLWNTFKSLFSKK